MTRLASIFAGLAVATFIACESTPPAQTPANSPAAAPSASASDPTSAPAPAASAPAAKSEGVAAALPNFDTLSPEEKGDRMKKVVLPSLTKVFQAHDAQKYSSFTCKTCHGPKFAPSPAKFLPRLKMSGDGFKTLMAKQPEVVKFMHEQVVPEMAKAMGQQPYDMKTNTGFGCKGCHGVD